MDSTLTALQCDWEELAAIDAKWSVLTDAGKQNAWSDTEFFATGEQEVSELLQMLRRLGYPRMLENALDFGCGVGRLTQALSKAFRNTWGVDISPRMLDQAKVNVPHASFVLNNSGRLSFPDGTFDLIYTARVLQHLPHPDFIDAYIREFLRLVGSRGIAVFHVPTYIGPLHRIQPRRRLYNSLRACGMNPSHLVSLSLTPMRVTALPEKRILNIVSDSGCRLVYIDQQSHPVRGTISKTFYAVAR